MKPLCRQSKSPYRMKEQRTQNSVLLNWDSTLISLTPERKNARSSRPYKRTSVSVSVMNRGNARIRTAELYRPLRFTGLAGRSNYAGKLQQRNAPRIQSWESRVFSVQRARHCDDHPKTSSTISLQLLSLACLGKIEIL